MKNFIKYVNIHNFKSIADLKLEDCRRINLFIGYPNVGKSNVLEALGLFSVPYLDYLDNLNKLVRFENRNELFNDLYFHSFSIKTNKNDIFCSKDSNRIEINNKYYDFDDKQFFQKSPFIDTFEKETDIKRYIFQPNNQWKSNGNSQLLPPFGENIVETLSYNHNANEVNEWIAKECAKFNLEYVLDFDSHSVKVQKRLSENKVRQLPYSSIADTLQRLIFYRTAIASNQNSVLLFEEPEAHAFPPYIAHITQDIIDAKTNQFFIVTHSPFVINDFLEYEHLRRETSIYLFDFKNDQTTVKRLTDEEMDDVYNYGIDLFFNIESFLRDE